MKRVKSTCIITTAGNRKSVCDNKFEAIAEQRQNKAEAKRGSTATVVHQRHVEDVERREVMPRSGTKRSEDIEGRRKDPNLAVMLLSSSVESEPL